MNNLKDLANRARNRLLNKGLRDTYSNANAICCSNMNFFNRNNKNKDENKQENESPFKYLFKEDIMMSMSPEDKERFLLNAIRKYQEEKHQLEKDII